MPCEAKKMKSRGLYWYRLHLHLCLTLSLSVEVSDSRPFSNNFVQFRAQIRSQDSQRSCSTLNLGQYRIQCLGSSTGASKRGQAGDRQQFFRKKMVFQGTKIKSQASVRY